MRIPVAILLLLVVGSAGAQDRFGMIGPYSGGGGYQVYAGADGALYSLTLSLQVMRSTDDGLNWIACAGFKSDTAVPAARRLAVDSSGILYGLFNDQLWRSGDRGATWELRPTPFSRYNPFLEVSRSGDIYLSASSGNDTAIYRSSDHGDSWMIVPSPPGGTLALGCLSIAPDGTLIAGRLGGIWRTTNDGATWVKMPLALAVFEHAEVLVASGGGRLWAVIAPYARLATSNDNGATWRSLQSIGIPSSTPSNNLVTTSRGALLLSTEVGIYLSGDLGEHWSIVSPKQGLAGACWVAASPSGTTFGISGDLRRSLDDGLTWTTSLSAASAASITVLVGTADGTTMLAGTVAGIFRSSDGGTSWLSGGAGLPEQYTAGTIFRGTGRTLFVSGSDAGGVYRSLDNGLEWVGSNRGLGAGSIYHGLLFDDTTILVASNRGVWRSSDNGDTWRASSLGLDIDTVYNLVRTADGSVLVSSAGLGIYRSTDRGNRWFASNSGMTSPVVWSLYAISGGTVFATTPDQGIFRSRDNGRSWEQVATGFGANYGWPWVHNDAGTLYVGAEMLQRSTDNGNSWSTAINQALSGGLVRVGGPIAEGLMIDGAGQIHVGISAPPVQGTYRMSVDSGAQWVKRPVDAGVVHSIRAIPAGGDVWFAGSRGAFYTVPSIDSMTVRLDPALLDVRVLDFVSPAYGLAGGADGLYRIRFEGDPATWEWLRNSTGLPAGAVSDLAVELNGRTIYAATEHGLYRSFDTATTWSVAGAGLGDIPITAVVITGGGSLLAASAGDGLHHSSDRGGTWSLVAGGLPQSAVTSLAVIGAGTIYLGTDGAGVWRSSDDGITWAQAGETLAQESIRSVALNAEGFVFVGTGHGAYRSVDRGATWDAISAAQSGEITAVGVGGTGRIYIASAQGIYQSIAPPTDSGGPTVVREDPHLQEASSPLISVLPNPAVGDCTLRYRPEAAGYVRIDLVDMTGRELRVLVDGDRPAGIQNVSCDVSGLAAGTYLVRMTIDGVSTTEPVTVVH